MTTRNRFAEVCFAGMVLLICVPPGSAGQDAQQQPWRQLYTGAEATGDHGIALWQFAPGGAAKAK